jgi:hypothetical protein
VMEDFQHLLGIGDDGEDPHRGPTAGAAKKAETSRKNQDENHGRLL